VGAIANKDAGSKANTLHGSTKVATPPKAAAVAGVIFAVLMITGLWMVRITVPANPTTGTWFLDPGNRRLFGFALQLMPFAGIAFLWFIGVLRNRLGKLEDQFFATVFLGSGLMFVACMFSATAIAGVFLEGVSAGNEHVVRGETYYPLQRFAQVLMNVFAIKMAAVFMFTTSTIALRTAILPRWIAISGFGFGLAMVAIIATWTWIQLIFPTWMLLVSVRILLADLSRPTEN